MNSCRTASLALVAALVAPVPAGAEGVLDAVLTADRAFAAQAADAGVQAAFLEYLAPDGVLFRPTAVNGRNWLQTHEEASGRLEWSPAGGAVSCDGQLAVTLGPWNYRQETASANGQYLTVWRRDAAGEWAVALDHGIDDVPGTPAASQAAARLAGSWPDDPPRTCVRGGDVASLTAADDRMNDAIRATGLDAALRRFTGRYGLALRDGHAPAAPAADWPADDATIGARLEAVTQGKSAEPGADMGFSYGQLNASSARDAAGEAKAVYVRVWVREDGAWRVAVDMLTLLPGAAAH